MFFYFSLPSYHPKRPWPAVLVWNRMYSSNSFIFLFPFFFLARYVIVSKPSWSVFLVLEKVPNCISYVLMPELKCEFLTFIFFPSFPCSCQLCIPNQLDTSFLCRKSYSIPSLHAEKSICLNTNEVPYFLLTNRIFTFDWALTPFVLPFLISLTLSEVHELVD